MGHKEPGAHGARLFPIDDCWRWRLASSARFAHGSHAARADVEAYGFAVNREAFALHIGTEVPAGASLREAHIVTEGLGFSTNVAFTGHGGPPFHMSAAKRMHPMGFNVALTVWRRMVPGVKVAPSEDDAYPRA